MEVARRRRANADSLGDCFRAHNRADSHDLRAMVVQRRDARAKRHLAVSAPAATESRPPAPKRRPPTRLRPADRPASQRPAIPGRNVRPVLLRIGRRITSAVIVVGIRHVPKRRTRRVRTTFSCRPAKNRLHKSFRHNGLGIEISSRLDGLSFSSIEGYAPVNVTVLSGVTCDVQPGRAQSGPPRHFVLHLRACAALRLKTGQCRRTR